MIHNFITEHITGDRMKACSQVHYEFGHNPSHDTMVKRAKRIYVKTDYIPDVFRLIESRDRPVVVISHNSDYNIIPKLYKMKPKCVRKWYAQNVAVEADDLIPVPIGCENVNTPAGYSGNMAIIDRVIKLRLPKKWLCFMNFNMKNNLDTRVEVFETFYGKPWVMYEKFGIPFDHCMKLTAQSKFVLCPEGNGIDTHRVWESLYLGSIPIVKRNVHFSSFDELPIIMVDDWSEITQDRLNEWWEDFDLNNFNLEKMRINYWKRRLMADV